MIILILLITFLISPLISLPIIIYNIKKNRISGYVFLCLFLSLLAYFFIPPENYDLNRYYESFNDIKNISFLTVYNKYKLIDASNYVFYLYMKLIQVLGLNKECLPFVSVGIVYGIIFYIVNKETSERKVYPLLPLFIILSMMPYIYIVSGIRNYLALSLVFFSIWYSIKYNKYIIPLVLFFISFTLHKSIILVILIYAVSCFVFSSKIIVRSLIIILTLLLLPFVSDVVLKSVVSILSSISALENYLTYFTYGSKWGIGSSGLNIKGLIANSVSMIPLYLSIIFVIFTGDNSNKLKVFLILMAIVIFLFKASNTIFIRYSVIYWMVFTWYLIINIKRCNEEYRKSIFYWKFFMILFLCLNLTFSFNYYKPLIVNSWGGDLLISPPFLNGLQ